MHFFSVSFMHDPSRAIQVCSRGKTAEAILRVVLATFVLMASAHTNHAAMPEKPSPSAYAGMTNEQATELLRQVLEGDIDQHRVDEALWRAAQLGLSNWVEIAVAGGGDIETRDIGRGTTPLMEAAMFDRVQTVRRLVALGAQIEAKDDITGSTPFLWAASAGHLETVAVLAELGADINARNGDGDTALILAAYRRNEALAELLGDLGVDVSIRNRRRTTALDIAKRTRARSLITVFEDVAAHMPPIVRAAKRQDLHGVEALLNLGDDVNVVTKDGRSALHFAALSGNGAMIDLLLVSGAHINAQDANGVSPLMAAVQQGQQSMVMMLMDAGADPNLQDGGGRTALVHALANKDIEMAAALLTAGANPILADHDNKDGIYFAAEIGNSALLRRMLQAIEDQPAEHRRRVLDHALRLSAYFGRVGTIQYLLREGASIEPPREEGQPPLVVALAAGQMDAALKLLDAGASVDALDDAGNSTLHLAAAAGFRPVAAVAIARGVDLDGRNADGYTPLMSAASSRARGAPLVAFDLVMAGADPSLLHPTMGNTAYRIARMLGNASRIVLRMGTTLHCPQAVDLDFTLAGLTSTSCTASRGRAKWPCRIVFDEGSAETGHFMGRIVYPTVNNAEARIEGRVCGHKLAFLETEELHNRPAFPYAYELELKDGAPPTGAWAGSWSSMRSGGQMTITFGVTDG